MRLIKPSYKILTDINGEEILKRIEAAGRTCYKSEDKITIDSAKKFVAGIIKSGHESVIEHESISVRIICDRGVTHEIVRHRLASYSQESTRYVNYSKGERKGEMQFIIPNWISEDIIDSMSKANYHSESEIEVLNTPEYIWYQAMLNAEHWYNMLIDKKWKPQQARSVLPNSLKTEIVMTCNIREWRHFFKLRTANAAHPQMREIAIPMLEEFKTLVPIIFDNIN